MVTKLPMASNKKTIKKSALAPTALIAGGAGFIGSHLAETLLLKDSRVIVLDNFKTGRDIYVNSLLENPKFALFNVDINQGLPTEIESVDYIFHLAAIESYLYEKDEVNLDSLLTNAIGTKNLLDLAKKSSAKFLFASSIDVYQGMISPINLDHYFGQTAEEEKKFSLNEAKRFAEALVWQYYKRNLTDVRIVRLPEIYGPRMNLKSTGNLGRLLEQLLENKNLIVHGEGTEKEYYLYIEDAVAGMIKAMFNKDTEGQIYTLVHNEPHAVLETTYLIKGLSSRETQVEFKQRTQSESIREPVIPDTNLRHLHWEPKVPFKDGITKTLNWFGYDINEHSFKPNKIVEEKQKEKTQKQNEQITSLGETQETKTEKDTPKKALFKKIPQIKLPKISFRKPKKKEAQPTQQITSITSKKHPLIGIAISAIILLIIFAVTPLIQTYIHTKKALSEFEQFPTYLAQMDINRAKSSAEVAFQELTKARNAISRTKLPATLLGKKSLQGNVQELLSSTMYFSRAGYYSAKALAPFTSIWEVLRPDSEREINAKDFSNTKLDFANATENLQFAIAEYKQVDTEGLPKPIKETAIYYGHILEQAGKSLEIFTSLSSEMPNLLGADEKRRYLILFQNSNEIRPTGGFTGSYSILELEKGKIKNLVIDDVYNPDGQIDNNNISVTPPEPIARLLKEQNLHIRNANWNPDFPESAKTITNLFYKLDGKEFNGVIAIDLDFTKKLLEVTGPIFLTAYNEEITSENIYERTQYHSEFNYTNGSMQKKSFLTLLGSKLLEKVFALTTDQTPKMLEEILNCLNQKHLMIYLSGSAFNSTLQKYGWDGSLKDTDTDYLFVVNANLGGTKANYYVQNEAEYAIKSKTRDGLLRAELKLSYNHTGKDDSWPGGPYTNYVRALAQTGSKLTGAKVINSDGNETDIFESVIISNVSGYTSFETEFTINPQENIQIYFYYDLPEALSITKENQSYALYIQKQPGTNNDKLKFNFEAPFGMNITSVLPKTQYEGGNVSLETTLETDKTLEIGLK